MILRNQNSSPGLRSKRFFQPGIISAMRSAMKSAVTFPSVNHRWLSPLLGSKMPNGVSVAAG